MPKKSIVYERLGGRRIPLYAEVGKYFTPDGSFNEDAFKEKMRKSLNAMKKEKNFAEKAGAWISTYLVEILNYLEEKKLDDASVNLFRAAVEESARFGIDEISLPPDHLQRILTRSSIVHDPVDTGKDTQEKKKRKIFEAALQVFAREGYHQATMEKIAELSGVGKGSLYRYFKSKEDLLDELLIYKYDEIVQRVNQILSKDNNILRQIQEAVEFWVTFIYKNHILYTLIQSEAQVGSGKRILFFDYLVSHLPMIKERVVALNLEKKLKTTGFYTVFYGILGFIDGVVQKWFRCGMEYDLRDEIPVILEVLFNGFVGERNTRKTFFIPPEETSSS